MQVEKSSRLAGKTVAQVGLDKLPGLFLVSIDHLLRVPDSQPPIEYLTTIPFTYELSEFVLRLCKFCRKFADDPWPEFA